MTQEAFIIAIAIAAAISFWWGWRTKPDYRPGCAECAAHERRGHELLREELHDRMHRGHKAPGLPAPTEDRYDCADITCPRNKTNRP